MTAREMYGGRYEVMELVGSGGMAQVYRARDDLLGREVALKVLNEKLSGDRAFVERFRREAQMAAGLNHPNIVSLFDYGGENGKYFIVMEYIDGRSLADIVRQEGPLLPERAAEIASDVSKALGRAHTAGLVHRDIKPSNIMITSSGQTKVTDFGIARALTADGEQTMTQTGMVIGTAAYLSPEQAQGNPVDARSDVYSLGCVLYEMLTGRAPFVGDTPLSIAYKHVRESPSRPSEVNSDVPQALDAVIMKALSKNPDNRYASATEMAEDLDRFLAGKRVAATPFLADETTVEPGLGGGTQVMRPTEAFEQEPEKKRGWVYALVALAILALFALLAWALAGNIFAPDVEVPNLVGRNIDNARRLLEEQGLEWEIETAPNRREEGRVFDQNPNAGTTVKEGDTVTLSVSEGPRPVEVPDLVGMNLDDARDLLRDEGLVAGEVTREASQDVEEDTVIRQFPAAGQQVDPETEIALVVSSGPQAQAVPNVVGLSEDEATSVLEDAGFEVDSTTEPSDEEEGIVIAQDPAAFSDADPGDIVTIVVSEGPGEQAMPDVTGQDGDEAEAALEQQLGLDVDQEDTDEPCAQPPGAVCDQDPSPGTPVEEGDDVTLFVQPGDA